MYQYSGESRIPGTDLRTRLSLSPSGTYGEVIRNVEETWGREGDKWNPIRTVRVDKVIATTERFPAYHTDGATVAVRELAYKIAGLPMPAPEPVRKARRSRKVA